MAQGLSLPSLGSTGTINGSAITQRTGIGGKSNSRKHHVTAEASSAKTYDYPRLSRPFELLRHEYDVIVIGSGYGGGVAASRMSRAGKSVCILERGRERWPGEYPVTLKDAAPELHTTGEFVKAGRAGKLVDAGNPTGLYHLVLGDGQNAFVANGLGGTSLLNANVFLRTDTGTMGMADWPPELRSRAALDPYYDMAEEVLQPAAYPKNWPTLPKLELLEKQANLIGRGNDFYRAPQTTRFIDGPNSTGIEMRASTLTGNDSTGINDGSKSSSLVTYISDAWNWGAEIFCECEVRYVQKSRSGYNVYFAWHGGKRGNFKDNIYADLLWVHAKEFVCFGAGSLGTTEILLRSKANGLPLSNRIGQGMSGNGDILSFGYNCSSHVNAMGREEPQLSRPIGPTITGVIDCREQDNPLNGFIIEEGAVPESLVKLFQSMIDLLPGKVFPKDLSFKQTLQRSLASLRSRVFGPYHPSGSVEHTQIYLIMSHDSNQAIMTVVDDKPVLKFMGVGRSEHVQYLNDLLAKMTGLVGGTLVNNPFYAALNQQEITVHPIGGACMSADGSAELGSATHLGELLTGEGKACHPGLIVVDGALIPTALGANPFATITALAERSMKGLADKHNFAIDYETQNGLLDPMGEPARPKAFSEESQRKAAALMRRTRTEKTPGIEFTEVMTGHVHIGASIRDFRIAENAARSLSQTASFFLTMHAWDESMLLSSPEHPGMLTGTFTHGSLPASPYMVLLGRFQLFNDDTNLPDTKNLSYDFDMVGTDGSKLHLQGYKIVNESAAGSFWDIWKATSTLYVTISKPASASGVAETIGCGIMNITASDLVSELTTLEASGASSGWSRVSSKFHFLSYFASNVFNMFIGPFGRLEYPLSNTVGYYPKTPPAQSFTVTASDGVKSPVLCWESTSHPSKPLGIMLLVPGASVDHQIYAMPTLRYNAVEFFTGSGFKCYTVTHRVGRVQVAEKRGWTGYDARLDVAAALNSIRERELINNTTQKLYVMAHCVGSIAFAAGLLDGTIANPQSWIAGICASNLFFTPVLPRINHIKANLPVSLTGLYSWFAQSPWFPVIASKPALNWRQKVMDQLLRFYPVGNRKELCRSATCHRGSLAFGRLWCHDNLSEVTHAQLDRFFGGISMTTLSHLIASGNANAILLNDKKTSIVTEENLRRLQGLKILQFSGLENVVFAPETTDRSYQMLRDRFGPDGYERVVFKGKGHLDCWMAQDAELDVWVRVRAHVRKCLQIEADD